MWYSIIFIVSFLLIAIYTYLMAKFFIGIGIRLGGGKKEEIIILPKLPKGKPKESKEQKEYNEFMKRIESYSGYAEVNK